MRLSNIEQLFTNLSFKTLVQHLRLLQDLLEIAFTVTISWNLKHMALFSHVDVDDDDVHRVRLRL
jgi:hypothetical protein